jgi:hypothetical protein
MVLSILRCKLGFTLLKLRSRHSFLVVWLHVQSPRRGVDRRATKCGLLAVLWGRSKYLYVCPRPRLVRAASGDMFRHQRTRWNLTMGWKSRASPPSERCMSLDERKRGTWRKMPFSPIRLLNVFRVSSRAAADLQLLFLLHVLVPSRLSAGAMLSAGRPKYIQSAASDAGWLLVSRPGSLGTCFTPIEAAAFFRVPILTCCWDSSMFFPSLPGLRLWAWVSRRLRSCM